MPDFQRTMDVDNGPTGAAAALSIYKFDGTADALMDRGIAGYDLTPSGFAASYVTEVNLTGIDLSVASIPQRRLGTGGNPLHRITGAITYEMLLRHESDTGFQTMAAQTADGDTEATNYLWSLRSSGTSLEVFTEFGAGSNQSRTVVGSTRDTSTQYHILVTRAANGRDHRVFVNGVKVDTFSFGNAPTGGGSTTLSMGADPNPSFPNTWRGVLYGVRITGEEWSDGQAFEAYNNLFFSMPPYLSDQDPAPSATSVAPDATVSLSIRDEDGDLDSSSIRISLNGQLAYRGLEPLSGWSAIPVATDSGPGYTFILTPAEPFEQGLQTVTVYAEDDTGNILDEGYSFTSTVSSDVSADTAFDDPVSGIDLQLGIDSDISVVSADLLLVAGIDEVIQHLKVGLRLYRGEWFLDTEAGIPYYAYILTNNPNTKVVEGLFRRDIIGDSDVEELSVFEMEFDRATRKLDIDFRAKSRVGVVEISSVFP
jgi:hypothetical protein